MLHLLKNHGSLYTENCCNSMGTFPFIYLYLIIGIVESII